MYFKVKTYCFRSSKIRRPLNILVLADLHGRVYSPLEGDLFGACRERKPDLILVPGDSVTARASSFFLPVEDLLSSLARLAPVYFVNGNHETRLRFQTSCFGDRYRHFMGSLKHGGVHVLNNASEDLCLGGNALHIAGLEVPLSAYRKGKRPRLPEGGIQRALGAPDPERFNILIAHNPAFAEAYFSWGADLTVSGHYHGGIVRSPFTGRALMDPYGFPLPRYGYGLYRKDGKRLIISGGMGDHFAIPRVFNPRELVEIRLLPGKGRLPCR